jgi:hypothetical protein
MTWAKQRALKPLRVSMAAFLILGLVAVGARSTAAAAQNDPVKAVAFLNVQFLNDHADLEPTTSAERIRLATIESLFKAKLEASGRYLGRLIPVSMVGTLDGTLIVRHVDETADDAPAPPPDSAPLPPGESIRGGGSSYAKCGT